MNSDPKLPYNLTGPNIDLLAADLPTLAAILAREMAGRNGSEDEWRELWRLANEATPGPWKVYPTEGRSWANAIGTEEIHSQLKDHYPVVTVCFLNPAIFPEPHIDVSVSPKNAAFIAQANPERIQRMLLLLAAKDAEIAALKGQ